MYVDCTQLTLINIKKKQLKNLFCFFSLFSESPESDEEWSDEEEDDSDTDWWQLRDRKTKKEKTEP